MISHPHKFIFIHIPKCAGTSIEHALYSYASDVSGILLDSKADESHQKWCIQTKNLRNEDLFKSINTYNDYFKFTVCRNPYDRLVSAYQYFDLSRRYKTFRNFINDTKLFKDVQNTLEEDSYLKTDLIYHLLPGVYFVRNRVDFIGRFENLQEDFNIVCDKIGIPRQKLPHANKRNHKHYTEYYDDETREIVAEKYAQDIEYFGYKFGE